MFPSLHMCLSFSITYVQEKRTVLASFDDRLELCKLAFGNIPNVVISDDEKVSFDRIAHQKNM